MHYTIEAVIGEGGMGTVYRARDTHLNRTVAIKVLSSADATAARGHVLREARAASALSHPHIVTIHAVEEQDGLDFIVMELVPGQPLASAVGPSGVPVDTFLDYALQLSRALASAHDAGIVHRDVKPGNLFLLGPIGNPYGIKLIDFGLAKGEKSGRISSHDVVLGTIEYMAPEQIVTDPSDARTDVYGLGVVMFRVFTGHLPFDVETDFELLAHQMFSPAPPPSWLKEDIDRRIEQVILRAMRKRPDNRYPSMQALVDDLERILGFSADSHLSPESTHPDDTYQPLTPAGLHAAEVLLRQFGVVLENGEGD